MKTPTAPVKGLKTQGKPAAEPAKAATDTRISVDIPDEIMADLREAATLGERTLPGQLRLIVREWHAKEIRSSGAS